MNYNLYKITYQLKDRKYIMVKENKLQLRKTIAYLIKAFSA